MEEKLLKILDLMKDIKYGFTDDDGNEYLATHDNYSMVFPSKYKLKINDELNKTKIGICWDHVELERYYLEREKIKCDSYCMVCFDNKMDPTHTFMVINDNGKYYWLENLWNEYRGVNKYEDINSLFNDVKNVFCKNIDNKNDIRIYKYDKPLERLDCISFYEHVKKGSLVKL